MLPNRKSSCRKGGKDKLRQQLLLKQQERKHKHSTLKSFLHHWVKPNPTDDDISNAKDYASISNLKKEISRLEEQAQKQEEERAAEEITKQSRHQHTHKAWYAAVAHKTSQATNVDSQPNASDSEDASEDEGEEAILSTEMASQIEEIQKSKIFMALQGLRSKSRPERVDKLLNPTVPDSADGKPFERPDVLHYNGRVFHKNKCYHYKDGGNSDWIVGITSFLSAEHAECVLVVPFSSTFLGMEEEGVDFRPTYQPSSFVQLQEDIDPVSLRDLGKECLDVATIPDLVYKPQKEGDWFHFAYFYKHVRERSGKRTGKLRCLDLFAGAGGMSQGLHMAGFQTVLAVEKDPKAAQAFQANHPDAIVENRCVIEHLDEHRDNAAYKRKIGPIDHVHGSPPCQGFSGANVFGGKNDKANNDLSLTWVRAIDQYRPVTGTLENVPGMWRRKNQHYLKLILMGLLQLGYQVRCCQLDACEFGDPQARPRLFIFAAQRGAYLPNLPHSTHGDFPRMPIPTVQDALKGFSVYADSMLKNEHSDDAKYKEERLLARAPAPTIRASKPAPMHYEYERPITMAEMKALFSLPPNFALVGTARAQRRQLGNSVPVELARAVGEVFRAVLQYKYSDEG
jgi:site-specific DNA-cytosine methylase